MTYCARDVIEHAGVSYSTNQCARTYAALCKMIMCHLWLYLQRVGVGPTGDILDIIKSWPPEQQQRAHEAIEEIEEQALRDMQVGAKNHGNSNRLPRLPFMSHEPAAEQTEISRAMCANRGCCGQGRNPLAAVASSKCHQQQQADTVPYACS